MKRILSLIVLTMIVMTLPACRLYSRDSKNSVLEYAMIATDGRDLAVLDQYPNLEYVDLRGSTCFDDILEYAAAHPTVKVRYSIPLGEAYVNLDVEEITLNGSDAVFEDLMNNLKFLRMLKTVHIDQISISKTQLDELKAAYPHIGFTYTVKLGNEIYDPSATKLDLSRISSEDAQIALSALGHLPNLTHIDLVDASGKSSLSVADCNALMNAYPQISFNYHVQLFGQKLSPKTESISFKDVRIEADGLELIQEALMGMPNCRYISFENCGIENEAMAEFRSNNPDMTVAWKIHVDKYSFMTDTEVILMQNLSANSDIEPLKYCTKVKYLDLTGCKNRDFSFLANMPDLECVVLTQTFISDLSGLSNCKNLTWLELNNCTALKDVSPLSGLSNLKYLNLSATKVKDLSPLDKLPLERFKCVKSSLDGEELNTFTEKHPNCLTSNTGSANGMGWRYDDGAKKVPFSYYAEMMKIFGYTK